MSYNYSIVNNKVKKMENVIQNKRKRQYVSPSLVKVGNIGIKTLGMHRYRLDSQSASTCHDESKHGNSYDCENPTS